MPHPKFASKAGKDGKFYFNLTAKNGQVIFSSEGYNSRASLENGTESVKKNSQDNGRFERKESKNGEHYFVLKAANSEPLGRSEMYKTKDAMENGIASVKTNAPIAAVEWE